MVIKSIRKNKWFLGIAVAAVITVSCKKQEDIDNKAIVFKPEKRAIDCKIMFPDTVFTNQVYSGVVRYKSILDTITTSFEDNKKKRYSILALTVTDLPYTDSHKLRQVVRDTFGAVDNREIPLYNIKFNNSGIFYIQGILSDFVVIDINKKNKDGQNLVREITEEALITHKVVVIDKPK